MKTWIIAVLVVLAACQRSEIVSVYTGNQAVYALTPASAYPIGGTVIFKERKDGSTSVIVQLTGTSGEAKFPVHLHQGDITSNGTGTLALLSPVSAKTGLSETVISNLADETKVTYADLLKLSAYLNVHLSDFGTESNVILAAGNIGSNGTKMSSSSRIGLCTGK